MDEIKLIKDFYSIGRKTLSNISGISVDDLIRYERGKETPEIITLMLNIETFEHLFKLSKNRLKAYEIKKIENVIKKEKDWRDWKVRDYKYKLMNIKKL